MVQEIGVGADGGDVIEVVEESEVVEGEEEEEDQISYKHNPSLSKEQQIGPDPAAVSTKRKKEDLEVCCRNQYSEAPEG